MSLDLLIYPYLRNLWTMDGVNMRRRGKKQNF